MRIHRRSAPMALLLLLGAACTDAGLYATNRKGPGLPDRALFEGTVCVPPAVGDAFPVKVLFAVQGGQGISPDVVGPVVDALADVSGRFTVPSVKFALVAYHSVATGLQGGFTDANTLQFAINRYASYQEQGPISLRAPLKLARSILSGDMLSGCPGAVARTRYIVVMLALSADTSCNNPDFNLGLDQRCTLLLPDSAACSRCELTQVTSELKALADIYRAGEVVVQPVHVGDVVDQEVASAVAAIAKAGGTSPLYATPSEVKGALNSINYGSLQRQLTLKRLIALNRNAVARDSQQLVDTDGDGVDDADEGARGLDPLLPDTDGDGLMDGVEIRMGMDATVANTVNGCNPFLDSDGDRFNDCEERVLGTEACVGDTDADGLPDLVEVLSRTNPLVPEDLLDSDGDGHTNVSEVQAHTDPLSADPAFRVDRGYDYDVRPANPTPDGRACYDIRVSNVGLVPTLRRPNPPYPDVPEGNNDVYLYMQAGRENDPRGAGVSSLKVEQIRFTPPARREPEGVIPVRPEDFTLGL